jgi:hypothetical protein
MEAAECTLLWIRDQAAHSETTEEVLLATLN